MKKYKNYIKACIFVFIFFEIVIALSYAFVPKLNSKEENMENVDASGVFAEPDHSLDVLFVGDSNAYSAFSPMVMYENEGLTSYVTANPGQLMYQTYDFIKKVAKKQDLKVVVMETNLLFRENKLDKAFSFTIKQNFGFIAYHNRWKKLKLDDFVSSTNYQVNIKKGFKYSKKVRKNKYRDYMKTNATHNTIYSLNETYLSRISNYCKSKNIELILVTAPNLKMMSNVRHDKIEKLAAKNNIPYYDMNTDQQILSQMKWDKYYRDRGDHLNVYGATMVSKNFAAYLKNNYKLSDHRNDLKYDSWNKDLIEYKKLVGNINESKEIKNEK